MTTTCYILFITFSYVLIYLACLVLTMLWEAFLSC